MSGIIDGMTPLGAGHEVEVDSKGGLVLGGGTTYAGQVTVSAISAGTAAALPTQAVSEAFVQNSPGATETITLVLDSNAAYELAAGAFSPVLRVQNLNQIKIFRSNAVSGHAQANYHGIIPA